MDIYTAAKIYGRGLASLDVAEEYDAHFDAGEFSGPAHARRRPRAERLLRQRARHAGGLTRSAFKRLLHHPIFNNWKNDAYCAYWREIQGHGG